MVYLILGLAIGLLLGSTWNSVHYKMTVNVLGKEFEKKVRENPATKQAVSEFAEKIKNAMDKEKV